MNTTTNAEQGKTSPTMNHDTTTPTNAAPLQTPSTENLADAEFIKFAERVLAVIAIDKENTASFKDMEILMDEVTALCRSYGNQAVSWNAVGVFFLPVMMRLYDLTFRVKLSENTAIALCRGQQELRKALRTSGPTAMVKALDRLTDVTKRQADAAEDSTENSREIANNTESIYNAVECWGEASSLAQAAKAGFLSETGKGRLRSLLDL